ncbi:MAG: DUF1292 domain-containing protein [Mycoplasmatales bacterium]|nr:DUF1292 domain-containing protein [Mycoplasmatales bacterium]
MENNDERTIIVTDENNNDVKGKVIFTFEANGEDYILYELNDNAYASKISETGDLSPILDDEWKLVEKIYNEFLEDQEKEGEDE